MRLKNIYLFILLLPLGTVQAQNTFEKEVDIGSYAHGNSLIQKSDGGYLVGGYRYYIDSMNQSFDVPCLVKFDVNGVVEWAKFLGKYKPGELTALAESYGGDFFASGYIFIDNSKLSSFIIKFDSLGYKKWSRVFENRSTVTTLSPCKDGGCLLGNDQSVIRISKDGSMLWEVSFMEKQPTVLISMVHLSDGSYVGIGDGQEGSKSILSLMKIDLSGSISWYRTISTSLDLSVLSSCKTQDGGFAICGETDISVEDKNIYVAKFDSSGALLWGKEIDAFGIEKGFSIAESSNGDLINVCSNIGKPPGVMILRINKMGVVQSLKRLVGANFFSASQISSLSDGGFVFTGSTGDSLSSISGLLFAKLDSNGNGCHLQDHLFSDHPSGAVITKTLTTTFGGVLDTVDISLGANLNFKEIDLCNISSVLPSSSHEENISLSPNPLISGKSVTIHVNEKLPSGVYDLSLLDLLGNTIKKEKINLSGTKQDILFDVSECPAGIYIIELKDSNSSLYAKKLIKN